MVSPMYICFWNRAITPKSSNLYGIFHEININKPSSYWGANSLGKPHMGVKTHYHHITMGKIIHKHPFTNARISGRLAHGPAGSPSHGPRPTAGPRRRGRCAGSPNTSVGFIHLELGL
jgi:hypothetical protein